MSEFDEIRPYNDNEIPAVIDRLLNDGEFLDTVTYLALPRFARYFTPLMRGVIKNRLAKKVQSVRSVADFQALIEVYLKRVLKKTVVKLSLEGLDNLDRSRAYLFISNHRDIAMDSAFVNWALYQNGFNTLRIAIGDNLLSKPFASDLMRLNKSFIVKRSLKAPREKLKAAKLLSKYVHHSLVHDNENVWIAQREGRAKDGIDVTNPAIISMLGLNKEKQQSLSEYLNTLNIVPVSISYEFDPCDTLKAQEIVTKATAGEYKKREHEDINSIATGIMGFKGRVHLTFGKPLEGTCLDADDVANQLDSQIRKNYVLHPTNCFAYELLEKSSPAVPVGETAQLFTEMKLDDQRRAFVAHVQACPEPYRDALLRGYANPVLVKMNSVTPSTAEINQGGDK